MRVALGHFWVNLAPHWADDAYMCGPGGAENRKCARHCSEKQIFEGPAKRRDSGSGGLEPNPGSLSGHFAHIGVTLGALWVYKGYFGIILVPSWDHVGTMLGPELIKNTRFYILRFFFAFLCCFLRIYFF